MSAARAMGATTEGGRRSHARRPLFGHEREYQVTFFGPGGETLSRDHCLARAVGGAARRLPSLRGRDEFDLFLANGARFYRDRGCGLCNLEYATGECRSLDELIAHERAGDATAERAVADFVAEHHYVEAAVVSMTNFDYRGHTHGSHENHLYTCSPRHLASQMVPLLASRPLVSGGGGFDDASPGLDFMCSPRVRHLELVVSRGAQDTRAVFTVKDERLARAGYERLQLLSGESLRCEASERLRFGPVALVLAAVEAGARPGDAVRLADPLAATNAFARDPGGSAKAALAAGGETTALDIQRHYLDHIASRLDAPWMPDWAAPTCALWRRVLEELAEDPDHLIGRLDWPTKRHLYRAHCERRGIPWQALPRWGEALRGPMADIAPPDLAEAVEVARPTPRLGALKDLRGPARDRLAAGLARRGLDVRDLANFAALRDELFELDIRFGEIGPESLFAALERAGVVAAGSVGADAVARAAAEPPSGTRAALRAAWIRHLQPQRDAHVCDWTGIVHLPTRGRLDLSDPFGGGLAVPSRPATKAGTARAAAPGRVRPRTRGRHAETLP